MIKLSDVQSAASAIAGFATRTPLLRSVELDHVAAGKIYVKADCLQLTGSFKFRGAYNRLSRIALEDKPRGVVAFSSGNHGQGVALAAKMLGIPATIIMPKDAPQIKINKTRSHGAKVVLFDRHTEVREEIGARLVEESGAILVPPFEDPFIMAGQGTSALEAIEDLKTYQTAPFDAYLVNAGGGGLLAGTSTVFAALSPKTELYSVEPQHFDDHARSFAQGQRQTVLSGLPISICDALMAPAPGAETFAINKRHVKAGLSVSDDEVKAAIRFAADNLKLVVEPGGAVALAAILTGKIPTEGRTIGLTVTGGNVDPAVYAAILAEGA